MGSIRGSRCAALPAALRRHVLVVEGDLQTALSVIEQLPATLTADEVDEAATALAGLPG